VLCHRDPRHVVAGGESTSVWPSRANSASSSARRVGSARSSKTRSPHSATIRNQMVFLSRTAGGSVKDRARFTVELTGEIAHDFRWMN
jgi:hypothetical protein